MLRRSWCNIQSTTLDDVTLQLLFYTQSMLIMGPVYDSTNSPQKAYQVSVHARAPSSVCVCARVLSHAIAVVAQAGVMACFMTGVLQLVAAPFSWTLFNKIPRCVRQGTRLQCADGGMPIRRAVMPWGFHHS